MVYYLRATLCLVTSGFSFFGICAYCPQITSTGKIKMEKEQIRVSECGVGQVG